MNSKQHHRWQVPLLGLIIYLLGSLSAHCFYNPAGQRAEPWPPASTRSTATANPHTRQSLTEVGIRSSSNDPHKQPNTVYYGYRFFNASTGRWLNRDPLAEESFSRSIPILIGTQRSSIQAFEVDSGGAVSRYVSSGTATIGSGPKGLPKPRGSVSGTLSIARETSNPYGFIQNAPLVFVDRLGLKPCSSCSAPDIQRLALALGMEYIYRSIEERREYGGKICCNDCLSRPYAANVVHGGVFSEDPDIWNGLTMANSKCRFGDKVVADWHTHPDDSYQTSRPNSPDLNYVTGTASSLDCDYVGYMTNSRLDTTVLDASRKETKVPSSSGDVSSGYDSFL